MTVLSIRHVYTVSRESEGVYDLEYHFDCCNIAEGLRKVTRSVIRGNVCHAPETVQDRNVCT